MKKFIVLAVLALIVITCSVIEGLVENPSPLFIQINGLLMLASVGALPVFWILPVNPDRSYKT